MGIWNRLWTRLSVRVRSLVLHRAVTRGMQEHPELTTIAEGSPEVRLMGLDPIRVLLIGSGLAVGYGVRSHAVGLTGALAEAIQADGPRGVIVQNRAKDDARIEQTVDAMRAVGATACNVVVWCPSLLDLLRTPDRGGYHRALVEGLGLLRETARPGVDIVVCGLPLPTKRGPIEDVARAVLPRFNRALVRAIEPIPDVRYVETPGFTSLLDPAALSPEYYRLVAGAIVRRAADETTRTA